MNCQKRKERNSYTYKSENKKALLQRQTMHSNLHCLKEKNRNKYKLILYKKINERYE